MYDRKATTMYSFRWTSLWILCLVSMTATAEVPQSINYQGRLTNPDGTAVMDSTYQIAFAIYDQPSGGTLLWSCPPQAISVTNGLFTYPLGTASALPDDLFSTDTLRWLQTEVSGEPLTPRARFVSAAYAYHALRSDTAAYALSGSGSGGWLDHGTVVALATPGDSVGVGTATPKGKLDVAGDAYFRRADRPGDQIIMNVSSGPVGLKLRSGTTGGTPLIDFANDDTTDFDARLVLVADTAMWLYGKPYVNLKLAGNMLVERTQATSMPITEETDGIRSYYTYQGSSAGPFDYQGSAIHATALVGGNGSSPVGTVTGIASQAAMIASGNELNELTPLFLSCNTLEPARLWGIDLNVHGPVSAQANLIQGMVNFVNNYNPDPVTSGAFGLSVVTKPGRGGAATPEQLAAQTYPLDVGLGIAGKSGDGVIQTEGYKTALQIGGSVSAWMAPGERSVLGTGILVSDVVTAGARFENFHTATTPALSIDVPYAMQITESDSAKWLLSREGTGTSASLLLRDQTEADAWWWGAYAGGDKRLSLQKDRVVVTRNGHVGIGVTAPANVLTVAQSSATDPIADAWTTYSSRRWKTNIQPLQRALDKVQRLQGVSYDWKSDGKHDIGLIAEEVGLVVPEVVAYEPNGTDARSIDYARLVVLLIEATKEQQETIDQLQAEVRELQGALGDI